MVPPADPPAGLARRRAATAYESLVIATLAVVLGFVLLPMVSSTPAATSRLALLSSAARAASFLALFVLYAGYAAWLWSGGRRTLPMQAWRLALRTAADGLPTPRQALCRYLAWWIGPACAIGAYVLLRPSGLGPWALAALSINYAWALIDADHQFLHDRIAGTRLVRS